MFPSVDDGAALTAIAALAEGLRRELYTYVRRLGRPVTRDDAAAHAGISRNLAAFHLDKLVAVGLLEARTEPDAEGRIGRPPKTYRPTPIEVEVSVPTRRYELAAEILLDAAVATEQGSGMPSEMLMAAARRRGRRQTARSSYRRRQCA
jgi:predicted ArsR family transcriptional regulator